MHALSGSTQEGGGQPKESPSVVPVRVLKSASFSYAHAMKLIESLNVTEVGGRATGMAPKTLRHMSRLQLQAVLNAEEPSVIQAVGGLLTYIVTEGIVNSLEERALREVLGVLPISPHHSRSSDFTGCRAQVQLGLLHVY